MDSQQYLFINLTKDKRLEDRKTAKEIRTHVMQGIGKARRKTRKNVRIPLKLRSPPPPPLAQLRLDVTSVIKPVNSTVRSLPGEDLKAELHNPERFVTVGLSRPFWNQNPLQILDDGWGMDPFAPYTITLALNSNMTSLSQRRQYFLFPFAAANSRSFRDLLGSPTMRDAVARDFDKGMSICLRRYAIGLRCINSSIASTRPQAILETHVIEAIIGFICYNYACQDFTQAGIHFAGLRGIVDLGGGTGNLPAQIRLMIMWIDITIALMRNHPPHYALPVDLLPILLPLPLESSHQMENMATLMLSISPEMSSVVHAYRDLKKLATWLETQSATPGIERDGLSVSLFLDPIAHRILSNSAPIMSMTPPLAKACALAALVIIILVRRKYDSFPGALPSHSITIINALRGSEMDDPKFVTLRLWLLTIAGIATMERDEGQGAQIRLAAEMRAAGLQNWRGVTERISSMPWFERLWEEECMLLGEGRPNGIGAAIAVALAARGACVTINYVSDSTAPRAAELAESIRAKGGKAAVIRGDVGDPESARKLVKETLAAFNTDKIDILGRFPSYSTEKDARDDHDDLSSAANKSNAVNNAGIAPMTPTVEVTPEEISSVLHTNFQGPFLLVQATLPYMPRGGRIINISTCLSRMGLHSPVYTASKAALDSLTYTWALEFGKKFGITVNAIAPGITKTEISPPDGHPEIQRLLDMTRLEGRMGTIEEIADAVVLVASPLSGWITGQYISVSGGINWL
ncbi:hypothetical protein GQX73_g9604 [Xylaria multiplex]|uniref:Uncharacterized protein n=1 Tax=Xylaria multiplex TaxID=323545 RepID=A0A7C8MJJ7_9PEZI|nr:hypothetical protein GQX73_g9604 [Xylaria multiplex]